MMQSMSNMLAEFIKMAFVALSFVFIGYQMGKRSRR